MKLRVIFYLVGIFRTSSPGDSLSGDSERTVPRRWERGQVIYKFAARGRSTEISVSHAEGT